MAHLIDKGTTIEVVNQLVREHIINREFADDVIARVLENDDDGRHVSNWKPTVEQMDALYYILQQRSAMDCPLFINSKDDDYITVLLDASGGKDINTPLVALNLSHKIGYAGGISPDNVVEKLTFLMESDKVGDFWIDMESGVRTDD